MENKSISQFMPKVILGISIVWSMSVIIVLGIGFPEKSILDFWVNVFELVTGLTLGTILLLLSRSVSKKYAVIGTALAVFSWTMGQIYWFSFTMLTEEFLPYPSVGDMGFTGAYFLLIGVMGILKKAQPVNWSKPITLGYIRFSSLLILLVPVILVFAGKNRPEALIYNFILSFVVSYTAFRAFSLWVLERYRFFVVGIFLLCLTDILFMCATSLFPNDHSFASDVLYPISLSALSYGIMKGDLQPDD